MKELLDFSTKWLPWSDANGPANATASELSIIANGTILTTLFDKRSRTVRPEMRVAAFELAQWLAFNWWRLRWEPERRNANWRESHRLPSIGGGTVWPDITFVSDLQMVGIVSLPTEDVSIESVQYIVPPIEERVSVETFERSVRTFLDLVAGRLGDLHVNDSDSTAFLELLDVLQTEQSEPEVASYRQMEATLGFDPDQAPDALILMLGEFAASWGENSTREVVASSSPDEVKETVGRIKNTNLPIRVDFQSLKGTKYSLHNVPGSEPWEVAMTAAKHVRRQWGLGDGKLDNKLLANRLDVGLDQLLEIDVAALPIGLAKSSESIWSASFRKRHPTSRRFEVCRLIGDYLVATKIGTSIVDNRCKNCPAEISKSFLLKSCWPPRNSCLS